MSDALGQIETLVNLMMQSFECQIRLIHSIGNHPDRRQHIQNLRSMVYALSQIVEKEKQEMLESIEHVANASAREISAMTSLLGTLAEASKDENVQTCYGKMASSRNKVIHRIGTSEAAVEERLITRTKAMQDKISLLLDRG